MRTSVFLAFLVAWAYATDSPDHCVMPLSRRVDAADRIHQSADETYDEPAACRAHGFCFAPTPAALGMYPWCYHPSAEHSAGGVGDCEAPASSGDRRECGSISGEYDEASCAHMGCCWRAGGEGEPWCYLPAGEGVPLHGEL